MINWCLHIAFSDQCLYQKLPNIYIEKEWGVANPPEGCDVATFAIASESYTRCFKKDHPFSRKIHVATYVCYTKKARLILSKDNCVLYIILKIRLSQRVGKMLIEKKSRIQMIKMITDPQ